MTTDWHSYPTNFSNGTGVDGPASFFWKYPASQVPMYGYALVILIWVASFSLSLAIGVRKALATASFVTGVIAVYLWRVAMIDISVLFILVVITIIGVIGGKEENSSL